MRYSNLSFFLEVIPNASPQFNSSSRAVQVGQSSSETATLGLTSEGLAADFAVAAIYCNHAIIGTNEDVQRISTNVHKGKALFLKNAFDQEDKPAFVVSEDKNQAGPYCRCPEGCS